MPVRPYNSLPSTLLDYLVSFEAMDAYDRALEAAGLDTGDQVVPRRIVEQVVTGAVEMSALPEMLVKEMNLPPEKAKVLALQLAEQVLRPVAEAVPGLEEVIGFLKNQEPNKIQTEETSKEDPSAPPRLEPASLGMTNREDTQEMQAHAEKVKQAAVGATFMSPPLTGIPKAVAEIVAFAGAGPVPRVGATFMSPLQRIVEARLRDVRDAYGTRAELEKPVAQGGLGLSGRVVADLMERIEAAVDAMRTESDAKMESDKQKIVERHADRTAADVDARAKEEQLLAKRYAELTGKAPTAPVGAMAMRASAGVSAAQSIAQATARIDTAKVKQAINATRSVGATFMSPPRGASPQPRGASTQRPQMQDVRPVQRLSSPTDELRAISLTDFRRFSKDPKAAVEKVMDKIDLLEKEGYGERLSAVKAWRDSSLNKWYVASVQEALARGLGVEALLAEKRAAGADVPSDAELQAIVGLNARLRF